MSSPQGIQIGALAKRSGLPVKTLRFYEELGLLPAIGRSPGGYRLFDVESLKRLAFIRRLKSLGLTLEEVKKCLEPHDAGRLPCQDIQKQFIRQIERIEQRINELGLLREELHDLLKKWQSDPRKDNSVICPNLKV